MKKYILYESVIRLKNIYIYHKKNKNYPMEFKLKHIEYIATLTILVKTL